ncbi:hypothetical protein OIU74_021637 [Salix koriyanagi]|uniref:Uncharacterized protein n=1 Tax=Salix koriyanagi TaxID=2511006 RepID=A0A9Q0WIG3_9ROSI|nr:hypothetical protein OIU74_021637 [Salix koriyanagi]
MGTHMEPVETLLTKPQSSSLASHPWMGKVETQLPPWVHWNTLLFSLHFFAKQTKTFHCSQRLIPLTLPPSPPPLRIHQDSYPNTPRNPPANPNTITSLE